MRWVLVALLLLTPVAAASATSVAFPLAIPVVGGGPTLVCSVTLDTSTTQQCRVRGFVWAVTDAHVVLQGGATASFYVDNDGGPWQAGGGVCHATTCAFELRRFSGPAFISFTLSGPSGASGTIALTREGL